MSIEEDQFDVDEIPLEQTKKQKYLTYYQGYIDQYLSKLIEVYPEIWAKILRNDTEDTTLE